MAISGAAIADDDDCQSVRKWETSTQMFHLIREKESGGRVSARSG